MNRPDEEFGAAYWEHRYLSGVGASKHEPSPSLVTEAGGLPPGRALDAGCGVGGDTLWLAARGWQVTAVDVSLTALQQGRGAADAAGPALADRIEWARGDLTAWDPGQRAFDLVTSHYVHVAGPQEELFRRLASWVAPGGTLLVVGHAHTREGAHGPGADDAHVHLPEAQITAHQITALLPDGSWEILVAEDRTHEVRRPDGTGTATLHDTVVRARRHHPARGGSSGALTGGGT